jgi:hypothetical protein
VSAGAKGTVNPEESVLGSYDGEMTTNFTLRRTHHIANVLEDDISVDVVSAYTIKNITTGAQADLPNIHADQTIKVTFAVDTYPSPITTG